MLFTVWAGKLTEGLVDALSGLVDDVPLFAVRGNRPLSTIMVHRIMARVKWGRWAVDFLRIVNGGEAPHRGAGMPPAAGKQGCEMEAPSGFALPGVPSGDGGAGGRRGEATDTAPHHRKRA